MKGLVLMWKNSCSQTLHLWIIRRRKEEEERQRNLRLDLPMDNALAIIIYSLTFSPVVHAVCRIGEAKVSRLKNFAENMRDDALSKVEEIFRRWRETVPFWLSKWIIQTDIMVHYLLQYQLIASMQNPK